MKSVEFDSVFASRRLVAGLSSGFHAPAPAAIVVLALALWPGIRRHHDQGILDVIDAGATDAIAAVNHGQRITYALTYAPLDGAAWLRRIEWCFGTADPVS